MPKRPRFPLPFSGGLDRATGVAVDEPERFDDLRNLIPKEGKLEARKGLTEAVSLTLTTPAALATDIPFIGIFQSENLCILVGYRYNGGASNIEVFYASSAGLNPVSVAAWGTLGVSVPIPQVFGVDSYRNFFLAHDEDDVALRLVTKYVDNALAIHTLQANLDNTSAKDVLFRGVARWGDYLLGWGFGTDSDKDRPEVVRISLPGDPLTFKPNHYFLAGERSQAVLACLPMGPQSVLVFKPTEVYEIGGADATTWHIGVRDSRYGLAGSHLAVAVGGVCYFWSLEGPRIIIPGGGTGDESQDIGVPLDLAGPDPVDLVAEGSLAYGFAHYIPEDRILEFNFPNRDLGKTRVYCLSLRDRNNPRWFYYERQVALACAGVLFEGATGSPVGYPAVGTLTANGTDVTVPWTNTDAVGDETVEVWLSTGAAYFLVRSVAVSGTSQSVDLSAADGIVGGDTVSVALRYRRGIRYTDDGGGAGVYLDPVTGGWDATALAQSVGSVVVASVPSAPANVTWDACTTEVVGVKTYMYIGFRWDNTVSGFPTHVTDILTGTVDDPDLASSVESVTVSGPDDRIDHFGGWYVHPTSVSERFVWVRHDVDGIVSAPVKVVGSGPHGGWIPKFGCLL